MTTEFKKSLGSDNHSGIHPELLQAIIDVNRSHAPAYGTDVITQKAYDTFKEQFGSESETHFVFNGTAANVLCIGSLIKSYNSVICSTDSHLQMDECGAPEKFVGCKLVPIKSPHGKLSVQNIKDQLVRLGDQHHSQPKLISLTQPTEVGTVYSLEELKDIIDFAKNNNLYIHIDGARLIYAAHHLNCSFKEMTTDLGVDVVSFGGTKNGLLLGEAVVLLNKEAQEGFKYLRKQAMQLPSKMRFIAAQFHSFLNGRKLWKDIARHGHEMATYLAQSLEPVSEIEIVHPVQANAVFVKIPKPWTKELKQHSFFYVWDEKEWVMRWMASFDTTKEDIDHFIEKINELKGS